MSSVSNGLYFLTLLLVSVMRVIYRKICHAHYLYIKRNVEKLWGARYTLGTRYLSKNTVIELSLSLGFICASPADAFFGNKAILCQNLKSGYHVILYLWRVESQ